ncbi:MAG: tryptophan 7-halogenase [Desulfobacteraceae bacterium]
MTANLKVDVLIIGAGPSGAAAAALIQKSGFTVCVVEKEKFPRFVIGESLLPRSMDILQEAGLLDVVHQQQYIVKPGAVFLRGSDLCAFKFSEQFTPGWDYAYQVPRDHFDHTLAMTIEDMGVNILWEHTVEDVQFTDSGPFVTTRDKKAEKSVIASRFVLDASGSGRVLSKILDLDLPSDLPVRESLFTHVTMDKRPQGSAEGMIWICMLPDNGWLWIIPFSNGRTSVGVVAEPDFYAGLAGSPNEKLRAVFNMEENAAKRLANVDFIFPAKQIKDYSISVKQLFGEGYALLGNATEFLDPVFSSGVTLALESASRSAQVLIKQLKGESVDWQIEYADYMMAGVNAFRTYVKAWYDGRLPTIFFSSRQSSDVRNQICSVLSGYVWDEDNIYVAQHERAVSSLAKVAALMNK